MAALPGPGASRPQSERRSHQWFPFQEVFSSGGGHDKSGHASEDRCADVEVKRPSFWHPETEPPADSKLGYIYNGPGGSLAIASFTQHASFHGTHPVGLLRSTPGLTLGSSRLRGYRLSSHLFLWILPTPGSLLLPLTHLARPLGLLEPFVDDGFCRHRSTHAGGHLPTDRHRCIDCRHRAGRPHGRP